MQNATKVANTGAPALFNLDSHALRVQTDDEGSPWFNANDVCSALDLSNPHKAVADHVDGDDLTKREVIDGLGRTQRANYVNESGSSPRIESRSSAAQAPSVKFARPFRS